MIDPVGRTCRIYFQTAGFSKSRITNWRIYGAKDRVCSKCGATPGNFCVNLNLTPKAVPLVAGPHEERIDWGKIHAGLQYRGYIK